MEITAGLDYGIWNQMFDGVLVQAIATFFWIHGFQLLWTCFIHHKKIDTSLQQNADVTKTCCVIASITELNNSDNNKHNNISSLGIVNDFDTTHRDLLANKFTVTWMADNYKVK